jgi:hypothetical protein
VEDLPVAAVFLGVVAVLVVAGLRLGMLVAPSLDRLTTPDDEEPGAPDE